jgi:hypothetical protein
MSQGFYNRMNMDLGLVIKRTPSEEEISKRHKLEDNATIKNIGNPKDREELETIEKTFGSLDQFENGHSLRVAKGIEIGKDDAGNKYIAKNEVIIKYATDPEFQSNSQDSSKKTNLDFADILSADNGNHKDLQKKFTNFKPEVLNFGQGSYNIQDQDFEYGKSRTNGALTFVTNLKTEDTEKKYQFFFNGDTISVAEKIETGRGNFTFRAIEDNAEKNSLIDLATQKINSKNAEKNSKPSTDLRPPFVNSQIPSSEKGRQ